MGRNILVITTDQQRFDSLGCNGGTIAWSEAELQFETTHADVTVEHLLPHGEAR